MSARRFASPTAGVFAAVGWLVLVWPGFGAPWFAQVYALVVCGCVGAVGACAVNAVLGGWRAASAVVGEEQAYRELTSVADVVGVLRDPEVDR